MWKKILALLLFLLVLIMCAIWAPWRDWDFSLPSLLGITPPERFATLQVTSLAGEVEIFVDDELRGSVGPEGSPFMIEDVKPGQRLVKLERKSEQSSAYVTYERLIRFNENIDTVIAYELGPTMDFSEGNVISAYESYLNEEQTKLNVTTEPEGVEVFLDGVSIGTTPVEAYSLDTTRTYKLSLEKRGYERMEINLLPESDEAREQLKGFDILVEANLFLVPMRIQLEE